MNKEITMYGCDINEFVASVKDSITYKLTGASIVMAGLMSDAQEMMAHGDTESARQYLNRAKYILAMTCNGELALYTAQR